MNASVRRRFDDWKPFIDWAVAIIVPCLMGVVGYFATMVYSHETQIKVHDTKIHAIEKIADEAKEDHQSLVRALSESLKEMRDENREAYRDVQASLAEIRKELRN